MLAENLHNKKLLRNTVQQRFAKKVFFMKGVAPSEVGSGLSIYGCAYPQIRTFREKNLRGILNSTKFAKVFVAKCFFCYTVAILLPTITWMKGYHSKPIFILSSYTETLLLQYLLVIVTRIGRNIPQIAVDSIMTCTVVSLFATQNDRGLLCIHYKLVGVVQMACYSRWLNLYKWE